MKILDKQLFLTIMYCFVLEKSYHIFYLVSLFLVLNIFGRNSIYIFNK